MIRTQVYLGREDLEALDQAAAASGASRSELIRRAIRETFADRPAADKLHALRSTSGSWKGRAFSGAEYVDAVRDDLNERLLKLGLD